VNAGFGGHLGGVVGVDGEQASSFFNSGFSDLYWDNLATAQTGPGNRAFAPGGVVVPISGATDIASADFQSGYLPTAFDSSIWKGIKDLYPQLQWFSPARPPLPIVFVHGICSSADLWTPMQQVLSPSWRFGGAIGQTIGQNVPMPHLVQGADIDYYTVTFRDPAIRGGLTAWAIELGNLLKQIKQARGDQDTKFIVIAHSAGGLAARALLQIFHNSDIAHLITYGTPHSGTGKATSGFDLSLLANLAPGTCAQISRDVKQLLEHSQGLQDMAPGSRFLNQINTIGLPNGVLHTSLIGTADQLAATSLAPAFLCPADSDCVVSADSQNIAKITVPPLPSLTTKPRKVTDRTHAKFNLLELSTPGEPQDVLGILWAIEAPPSVQ
jgi:triacylglycerol esterase/lipase EstA (alpha/beta hydrolase family)